MSRFTTATVIHYLGARGRVSPDEIVDGGISVVEVTRRNRNFKVIRASGDGYFIKQAKIEDPMLGVHAAATVRVEAILHQLARSDSDFAALVPLLPTFYGYDPARNAAVFGLLRCDNVADFHRQTGTFPLDIARALAYVLARYHRGVSPRPVSVAWPTSFGPATQPQQLPPTTPTPFPGQMPWILSFHRMRRHNMQLPAGGIVQLHDMIANHPQFASALDSVQQEWQVNAFIHGDMKWENCLLSATSSPRGSDQHSDPTITIVDWELADFGDACWDAAAIIQAYLAAWVTSMPTSFVSPEKMLYDAAYPLTSLQPAIRNFWRTYCLAMAFDASTSSRWLLRATRYAALRLIQTAYELLQYSTSINPVAACLLQVSLNMLLQPRKAAVTLLGISFD